MAVAKFKFPLSGWILAAAPSERLVTTTVDSLYYTYTYGLARATGSGVLQYDLAVVFPWDQINSATSAVAQLTRFYSLPTNVSASAVRVLAGPRRGYLAFAPDATVAVAKQQSDALMAAARFKFPLERVVASVGPHEGRAKDDHRWHL